MDWTIIERWAWPAANLAVAVWAGRAAIRVLRQRLDKYLTGTEERNAAEVAVLAKIEESLRRQNDRTGEVLASCKRTEKFMVGRSVQPRLGATQMDPDHMDPPPASAS
jgi:hypothetical protein